MTEKKILNDDLRKTADVLREINLDPSNGLPEEIFLLASSFVPIPNVDLIVVNSKNQILLARRNDEYYEKCWHTPGACLFYGESLEKAVHRTALKEIGCDVEFDKNPIAVCNVLRGTNPSQKYPRERGHNVAVLYRCRVPVDFKIDNGNLTDDDNGFLKWFDKLPVDFMKAQEEYKKVLKQWM